MGSLGEDKITQIDVSKINTITIVESIRQIEVPVFVDKIIDKPVYHEVIYEKPVIVEKEVTVNTVNVADVSNQIVDAVIDAVTKKIASMSISIGGEGTVQLKVK